MPRQQKVTVVWRADPSRPGVLHPAVLEVLASVGFDVGHLAFREEDKDDAFEVLAASDAVLTWVDPISGDRDRGVLDGILRDVARGGVVVYTHPDTILKMGTKDVLYDTRALSWSQDTHRYPDFESFADRFPDRIADGSARVLKQHRGNGGIGVWKVQLSPEAGSSGEVIVKVQHAAPRDGTTEDLGLGEFVERMKPYFDGSGHLIDQAFASRVAEGMVRAYLVRDGVVGFARQYADRGDQDREAVPSERVFGIPAAKTMRAADDQEFAGLRSSLEDEWVPGMSELLNLTALELPLLWDADFLFRPRDPNGEDTFLLCEINVSCVSPYPDVAPMRLAAALRQEFDERPR
jgi:hypothetical protein